MTEEIAKIVNYLFAMIMSLSMHEASHAIMAKWRGDDTAEQEGRLTLNPLAHLDPLGTVILPILGVLLHFPIVGWAKPVPIDPRNFKKRRLDELLVAMAGPGSNLILAFLSIGGLVFIQGTQLAASSPQFSLASANVLSALVWVNAALAFFNLIPLPPLDGAALVQAILPARTAEAYHNAVAPYGFMILLVLIYAGGMAWVGAMTQGYVRLMYQLIGGIL